MMAGQIPASSVYPGWLHQGPMYPAVTRLARIGTASSANVVFVLSGQALGSPRQAPDPPGLASGAARLITT
jgi:hypothetical protein